MRGIGADAEEARGGALDQGQRRRTPAGIDGEALVAPATDVPVVRQARNHFGQRGGTGGGRIQRIAQVDLSGADLEPLRPARQQRGALMVEPSHRLPGDDPGPQYARIEAVAGRQPHGNTLHTGVDHGRTPPLRTPLELSVPRASRDNAPLSKAAIRTGE